MALPSPAASPAASPGAISEDSLRSFQSMFESYVEKNFGRGTRSQTVTRETYDSHRRVLAEEGDTSRRRSKLVEQGYRLGTADRPHISREELAAGVESVLWRYKSEGRGNNYMSTETRPRIVAPVEDFYAIISRLHRARPPASGQKRAFKLISERYVGIPREVVIFYMRSCPHCLASARRRPALMPEPSAKRLRTEEEEEEEEDEEEEEEEGSLSRSPAPEEDAASSDGSQGSCSSGTDAAAGCQAFLRLLALKNLNLELGMARQDPEKVAAIVAACGRQFPGMSESRIRSRIRVLLKTARRSAPPDLCDLPTDAGEQLLAACVRERAFVISALANSAESWPIDALSEEEVKAAIRGSPAPQPPPPPQPQVNGQPPESDAAAQNGALPHFPGMADFAAATFGANVAAPDLGVFIRTLMTLSAMSVFPIEPAQLANSFRWVGFLLLMVAQAMEGGAQAPNTESNS